MFRIVVYLVVSSVVWGLWTTSNHYHHKANTKEHVLGPIQEDIFIDCEIIHKFQSMKAAFGSETDEQENQPETFYHSFRPLFISDELFFASSRSPPQRSA